MAMERLYVFAATFESMHEAREVVRNLRRLQDGRLLGRYDCSVIRRDSDGTIHVERLDELAEHGMAYGLLSAALAGLVFPPVLLEEALASELAIDVMGSGSVMARVRQGVGRRELAEIGRILANSAVSMLVLGDSNFRELMTQYLGAAMTIVQKEVALHPGEAEA
jgi:uncharacterized membrane protein